MKIAKSEIDEELTARAESNAGAMSREEAEDFADYVIEKEGMTGWKMIWTGAGDICMRGSKTVYVDRRHIHEYPWQLKQVILHELAHADTGGDKMHWKEFFGRYIELLTKYACVATVAEQKLL